jgi:peptide/nickel transport system substrate-binding protein
MAQVAIDFFRKLDVNLDVALSDWGALVQRRNNRGPVAQGGWSVSCFANSGMDFVNPGTHNSLRSDGNAATPGWPSSPALEALRMQFFDAPELAQQQAIARDIQRVAMQDLPYIPLGGYRSLTAHKRNLADRVKGFAIFWGIKRT